MTLDVWEQRRRRIAEGIRFESASSGDNLLRSTRVIYLIFIRIVVAHYEITTARIVHHREYPDTGLEDPHMVAWFTGAAKLPYLPIPTKNWYSEKRIS